MGHIVMIVIFMGLIAFVVFSINSKTRRLTNVSQLHKGSLATNGGPGAVATMPGGELTALLLDEIILHNSINDVAREIMVKMNYEQLQQFALDCHLMNRKQVEQFHQEHLTMVKDMNRSADGGEGTDLQKETDL